jgi:hypothetical protein
VTISQIHFNLQSFVYKIMIIFLIHPLTMLMNQTQFHFEGFLSVRCWWLTPVILATKEAEIRKIVVQSQLRQIVP